MSLKETIILNSMASYGKQRVCVKALYYRKAAGFCIHGYDDDEPPKHLHC